uniref:PX domain-containing protein n=1 Tax=Hemiselmis tepida TaxID=464990 RepID=A0A7S0W349_9CRYP|mmetsp:Transcript_33795/g.86624  ORF Transcript_33795/g.86624 Transcript_33795/m.86624 type:complete len:208 (+) Transcript_33795:24-647(+)
MVVQGVAAFGHIAPPVVVYAKQPSQQRGARTLLCFPSEFTSYTFCVNAAGKKWDITKRYNDFVTFEHRLVKSFSEEDLAGREPCPEKNFFLSNSPSFIEHRRWRLEMYLNSLAHCPVISHSQLFKEFLEYSANMGQYYEDSDEAYGRMTQYDREQERLKMEKLAQLAKMPVRGTSDSLGSVPLVSPAAGEQSQWSWAGDALSLERHD